MMPLLPKDEFLVKYNIPIETYDRAGYDWEELMDIYSDYQQRYDELERTALPLFNTLIKMDKVHSVRYRIKDPEHVIEKIIRKRAKQPKRIITKENYYKELTDLIGLRAIHLFKDEWLNIHQAITDKWHQRETPVYYYREGDRVATKEEYKKIGCKPALHPRHYRSVHYIIKTTPTKQEYFAEIQVRTLFEEGWSEIDHKVGYPYVLDNQTLNDFLAILNRLAGSADEMATFIRTLKPMMAQLSQAEIESTRKVEEVKLEIDNSEALSTQEKQKLSKQVETIKNPWALTSLREMAIAGSASAALAGFVTKPIISPDVIAALFAQSAGAKKLQEDLAKLGVRPLPANGKSQQDKSDKNE